MIAALRYETVRLRTLRSTWWLLGLAIFGTGAIAFGIAWGSRTVDELGPADVLNFASGLVTTLVGLVAIFSLGHEYRYGTIRPALTAVPRRRALLSAKLLVTALWGLGVGVLTILVGALVVALVPGQNLLDGWAVWEPVGRVTVGYLILILLNLMVGMAFAGLFRNLPAAIVTFLVVPLVVEQILRAILLIPGLSGIEWLGKYLPFGAGAALVQTELTTETEGVPEAFQTVGPVAGGVTFGVFALLLLVLTWVLFERRDA